MPHLSLVLAVLVLSAQILQAQVPPPMPTWQKGTPPTQSTGISSQVGNYSQVAAYQINNGLPGSTVEYDFDTNGKYVMDGSIKINGQTFDLGGPIGVYEVNGTGSDTTGGVGLVGGAAANGKGIWIDAKAFKQFSSAKQTAIFLHELLHCFLKNNYSDFANNCIGCAHRWVYCQTSHALCDMANVCPHPPNAAAMVTSANNQAAACRKQSCPPCSATPQPPSCSCPPANPPCELSTCDAALKDLIYAPDTRDTLKGVREYA